MILAVRPRLFKCWIVYPWNKLLSVALISIEETNFVINRPFHVFFCNFWHGLVRKNSSTLLEKAPLNNEHIAPQNREILQKFVWWDANVCKLSRLCRAISSHAWDVITFRLGNFTNLRRTFLWFWWIFPNWSKSKPWKGLLARDLSSGYCYPPFEQLGSDYTAQCKFF